jgi:hypothetical protein
MRRRPQAPKTRTVVIVTEALRNYIPSTDPIMEWRRSEKGVPHMSYRAETNGLPWGVDIYLGHFYRVRVGTGFGEVKHSIPELMNYLSRKLRVPLEPMESGN